MRRVVSSIEITAPPDRIWPYLAEFAWWPQWGMSINAVDSDADRIAPGVTGRVRTRLGFWLPFTIDDVVTEVCWTWSVAGLRATDHHLDPAADSTRVRFTAPWIVAPYAVLMGMSLRKLKSLVEST